MNAVLQVAAVSCLLVSVLGAAITGDDICHGLDCPKFTVLNKTQDWELRHYGATKWASTKSTGMHREDVNSKMFDTLFNYIDGENANHSKILMTAPVLTKVIHGQGPNCESEFIMHFMLPHNDWNSPIQPTNQQVVIAELPAMDVYVRSFGGYAKDTDYLTNLSELAQSLPADASMHHEYFFTAGYDGPYQFTNRHNEVWIAKA